MMVKKKELHYPRFALLVCEREARGGLSPLKSIRADSTNVNKTWLESVEKTNNEAIIQHSKTLGGATGAE